MVFGGGEDVFCCPLGYKTDEELLSVDDIPRKPTTTPKPIRIPRPLHAFGHSDHEFDNHGHDMEPTTEEEDSHYHDDNHKMEDELLSIARDVPPAGDPIPTSSLSNSIPNTRFIETPVSPHPVVHYERPKVIPPSPATTLRKRNSSSLISRIRPVDSLIEVGSSSSTPRSLRDEELEEILEHDRHMHEI